MLKRLYMLLIGNNRFPSFPVLFFCIPIEMLVLPSSRLVAWVATIDDCPIAIHCNVSDNSTQSPPLCIPQSITNEDRVSSLLLSYTFSKKEKGVAVLEHGDDFHPLTHKRTTIIFSSNKLGNLAWLKNKMINHVLDIRIGIKYKEEK